MPFKVKQPECGLKGDVFYEPVDTKMIIEVQAPVTRDDIMTHLRLRQSRLRPQQRYKPPAARSRPEWL